MNKRISEIMISLLSIVQCLGLGLLGLMTTLAFGLEVFSTLKEGSIQLGDLLLLFIYLEVLAMVRIQLISGEIPLSIPFAIAIVALSRFLVLDMKAMDSMQLLAIAGAMLLLALALVAVRYWKSGEKSNNAEKQASQP